ncbi:MAG: TlpA family protein disulfide reductase [Coxiellaceae bacterium]|nr:TlpA family protein disulfide reductase [Coxiellaceae bacterium]
MKIKSLLIVLLMVVGFVSANEVLALGVGSRVPSVSLPILTKPSKHVNLAGIRAKYVYIDFWASWCSSCRSSLPRLSRAAGALSKKGLRVVGVNLDKDPQKGIDFMRKYGVSFLNLSDPKGASASRFGLPKIPSAFLVKDGRVVKAFYGYSGADVNKLYSLVQ